MLLPACMVGMLLTNVTARAGGSAPVDCGSLYPVLVGLVTVGCTHGPDPAPPGVDPSVPRPRPGRDSQPEPAVAADLSKPQVPCYGDGQSGPRVQAIYAFPADKRDRYSEMAPYIATWAAQMDQVFNKSAAQTGGTRHVRFVTDANCSLVVQKVELSSTGDDTFGNTMSELRAMGMNRTDRRYLVWMDSTVLCGIASYYVDDTQGSGNVNNGAMPGSIARVDSGCWGLADQGESVEAHELLHTLGGVQASAPNATPMGHCTDGADRMCYDDGSGLQQRSVCPDSNQAYFDCNHDDYYSTKPPDGSYLATHWDTADSEFLATTDPPTAVPPPAPDPSATPGPAGSPPGSLVPPTRPPGELGGAVSKLRALNPARLLGGRKGAVPAHGSIDVAVTGRGGVPSTGVGAVVLSVTVRAARQAGSLSVYPTGQEQPDAASIRFGKGPPRSTTVVVPVGSDGAVRVANDAAATVHVGVDVDGWFDTDGSDATGQIAPLTAARVLNTRTGVGGDRGRLRPADSRRVVVTGRGGVPTGGVSAVWLNLVASNATGRGSVTLHPAGSHQRAVTTLAYAPRRQASTLVLATVGRRGAVIIRDKGARTHLTASVVGWVDNGSNAAEARYTTVTPTTVFDTHGSGGTPLPPGSRRSIQVTGQGGVPASGVSAVMVQVEADASTHDGSVVFFAPGQKGHAPAKFSYWKATGAAQTVMVAVSGDGRITLLNRGARTGLRIDVIGYYDAGG